MGTYRAEIDGLRVIAINSVVLFLAYAGERLTLLPCSGAAAFIVRR
jgi:hypothetical protein